MTPETTDDDYLEGFLSSAFAGESASSVDAESLVDEVVPECVGRYSVVERIGRGGVGLVYRVEDSELGRDIAVKVLRAEHAGDPALVLRFRDEARICGRLTHPGVVTIHEIGELEDGRPYFAMKLIDGATLARMLGRHEPAMSTHVAIEVFEKICLTVAYAHDRGVLHGDLKPQNVMVGEFGEVQVMDWGFARELGVGSDEVEPARRQRGGGTPAYMAPEQVSTSRHELSARTDVFGLGAILCEILTGAPPYTGETREEVYLRAARGWQDDAEARFQSCDGDSQLVGLARRCLALDPHDRPANAGEVAAEVATFRAELEERARRSEIDAAEARAKAGQERRARRLTLALSIAIAVVVVVTAAAAFWIQSEAAERMLETQRVVEGALGEASRARAAALRGGRDESEHWHEALAAARRAAEFAQGRDAAEDLAARVDARLAEIVEESEAALRGARLAATLEELRPHMGDERETDAVEAEYLAAFAEAGIDLEAPVADVAEFVTGSRCSEVLISALDQWSRFRRGNRLGAAVAWRRLEEIAGKADSDGWRSELRAAFGRRDRRTLRHMARNLGDAPHSAASLDFLALCLADLGDREAAIGVYRHAFELYPNDYQIGHNLAAQLEWVEDPPRDEIARLYWVGIALRPRSAHALTDLGLALLHAGQLERALAFLDRAAAIRPHHPRTAFVRAVAFSKLERFADAVDAYRIAVDGGIATGNTGLGFALAQSDRLEEAVVALRRACELNARDVHAQFQLGRVLCITRRFDEAVPMLRDVVARDPDFAEAHCNLGEALTALGRFEEALVVLRKGHALGVQRGAEWGYPSSRWVEMARQFAQMNPEFESWRAGELEIGTAGQRVSLALIASRRGFARDAAKLFDEALQAEDELEADRLLWIWFEAGLAAARAATSEGSSAGRIGEPQRRAWCERATDWFESWADACLDACRGELDSVDPLGSLHVTQWRFEPSVKALGSAIEARADGDSLRQRWSDIVDVVAEVREAALDR